MDVCCPTEEAVSALLDTLVDPKLPTRVYPKFTPSESDQESVAKQVHSVVLLYNYCYIKQQPNLEFLGFEDFSKLAVVSKPCLVPYLSVLKISDATEPPPELSPTELHIIDACDIAKGLHTIPHEGEGAALTLDGWLVSKVAVLLLDSKKVNCFLWFGHVTEGVWSPIEKDVTLFSYNNMGSKASKETGRKKRCTTRNSKAKSNTEEEVGFKKIAFSAVKDATGIDQSGLVVLETHVAYSFSKVKTAARFYIMQCSQPNFNNLTKVPLESVIQSLQGPLFSKDSCWSTTSVVEYFHLLPYADILSGWFSRNVLVDSLQLQNVELATININNSRSIEKATKAEVSKKLDEPHESEIPKEHRGINSSDSPRRIEDDVIVLSDNFDGPHNIEVDESKEILTQEKDKNRNITAAAQPESNRNMATSGGLLHSQEKDKNGNISAEAQPESNRNMATSEGRPSKGSATDSNLKDEADDDSLTSQVARPCSSENVVTGKGFNNGGSSSQENGKFISSNDTPVVSKSNSKVLDKLSTIMASKGKEVSEAAKRVLLSRRDKLCLQVREMQDQIAWCDKDMRTILKGGEDSLALQIECVVEGCSDIRRKRGACDQFEEQHSFQCKRKKLQSRCEELDDVCYRKNWILPYYHLSALEGGFEATVYVEGTNFNWSSGGELHPEPREARESAAANMLVRLRDLPSYTV